jgi:tetratricopeptide (TPR) repeat protein
MMYGRIILAFAALFAAWNASGKEPELSDAERAAFVAYSQQNFHKAARLAREFRHTPHGRLLSGLCDVFDKEENTLKRGLHTLEELFNDPGIPLKIRLEAGLTLARTLRLEQLQHAPEAGRHSKADRIFLAIIKLAPDTEYARDAMFYHSLNHFSSCDAKVCSDGFNGLENFINNFRGPKKLLAPLHLLAEHEYIRLRKNYHAAVAHLESGIKIGFTNPNEQRSAMFRLGFFYYKYLKDRPRAEKALTDFLRRYPNSPDTPSAERFLKELREVKP